MQLAYLFLNLIYSMVLLGRGMIVRWDGGLSIAKLTSLGQRERLDSAKAKSLSRGDIFSQTEGICSCGE